MDAVDDAHEHDDAEIGVVPGIDEQGLERRVRVALGRRQLLDDGLQHALDVEAGLGRDRHGLRGIDADHLLDLLLDPVRIGGGQVDLVEDGDDLVVGVDGLIDVGERLRLDALAWRRPPAASLRRRPASARPRRRSPRGRGCPSGSGYRSCRPAALYSRRTVCALMVMPRSRSISMLSSTCSVISRAVSAPVVWIRRSASVDLPWSIWATMEKLRMLSKVRAVIILQI